MKFKGTTALFVVFIALGLFVYFTEFRNREAREQAEEAQKKAVQVEEKNISEISLVYPGLTISAKRDGETNWQMMEPAGIEADPEEWNQIAANIPRIEREATVSAEATDLKPFGLETPLTRVRAKTTDGKSFEIQFGDENPRKIHNYAKFADSGEVFLTPTSWQRLFQKTVADVRNKKLLTFQADDIDAIRIEDGKNQIELRKSGTDWLLTRPAQLRADGSEATTFISTVQFARAQSFADSNVSMRQAGLETPAVRVTLHDSRANTDRVLAIGSQPETDKYYARDLARDAIFIIDKEIIDKARRPLFDWRDKRIAQIQRELIDEIDIRQMTDSLVIRKSGADWQFADGRKLLWDKVSNMMNALEFDKAQEIIDAPAALSRYGLDKPRLEVRFRQGTNELLLLSLGSENPAGGVYVKASTDSAIKVVARDVLDKFNVKADDLLDKSPATQ